MKKLYFLLVFTAFHCQWTYGWVTNRASSKAFDWERVSLPVSTTPVNRPVSSIAQLASNLCWAACMQMITKYHGLDLEATQCKLVSFRREIYRDPRPFNLSECESFSCNSSSFESLTLASTVVDSDTDPNWNNTINTYNHTNRQDFDAIFSKAGFYSIEDTTLLPWPLVKSQIDNCRPFIIMINEGEAESDHAVVVKGYWEGRTYQRLLVNDPWGINRCTPKTYYLNYPTSLTATMNPKRGKVIIAKSFVHNIYPKSLSACTACTSSQTVVPGGENLIPRPATITHSLSESSVRASKMKSKKPNFYVKVHYISLKKLKNQLIPLQIDSVKTKHQVVDLINTARSRYIAYTLEADQTDTIWQPVKIAYSDYPKMINLNGNQIKISFRNDIADCIQYEHVIIQDLFQRYYRFSDNKNSYLVPSINYHFPDGSQLLPSVAYLESAVLAKIRAALD